MIRSMTGFGRGEGNGWVTEIRSVNHRFGEIHFRAPRNLAPLESRVKQRVRARVRRGRVEIWCTPQGLEAASGTTWLVDESAAAQVVEALRGLKERLGLAGEVGVSELAWFREIFRSVEPPLDLDETWDKILPSLDQALAGLEAMREAEGQNLMLQMSNSLEYIERLRKKIADKSEGVVEEYRDRLARRMEELLGENVPDPARLLQEAALLAERSDISEELTRLASHVEQFRAGLEGPGPHGKRLDFLVQEMHREVNTIGSKTGDMEISGWVVEAKCEVEKIREQTANVE